MLNRILTMFLPHSCMNEVIDYLDLNLVHRVAFPLLWLMTQKRETVLSLIETSNLVRFRHDLLIFCALIDVNS